MRPRDIGTRAETAVVKALRSYGFPLAERRALAGSHDRGDVLAAPGFVIEVKAGKQTENPSNATIDQWLKETRIGADNSDADLGVLVVRRHGKGDALHWWAYCDTGTYVGLVTDAVGEYVLDDISRTPVRVPLWSMLRIIRYAGWGDPL